MYRVHKGLLIIIFTGGLETYIKFIQEASTQIQKHPEYGILMAIKRTNGSFRNCVSVSTGVSLKFVFGHLWNHSRALWMSWV